jgi:hypothetical protein
MKRFFEDPWGPGRTSPRRSLLGMVVAPTIAFLLAPVPFFAVAIGGNWQEDSLTFGSFSAAATLLGLAFGMIVAATVVLGGPVWIILRGLRRESGRAYVFAGGVGGLLWAVRFGYVGSGALRADQAMAFGLCVVAGAMIALGFWLIARERGASVRPIPK